MPTAIRDASLTTLKRQQRALGAFRNSYSAVFAGGFPNGNAQHPEQPNTQTGDVPINARIGVGLCCATLAVGESPNSNGFQSPANGRARNF